MRTEADTSRWGVQMGQQVPTSVEIRGPSIELGAFLKLSQLASSGGEAKRLIQAGLVLINGQPETRRRHLLRAGDRVRVRGDHELVVRCADGTQG